MIVLEALAASLGMLALLAIGSKGMAYHVAMYATMALKCSTERLYDRMPSPFDLRWLVLALLTAGLFFAAYVTKDIIWIIAFAISVGAVVARTTTRSFRLMKVAALELGLQWPAHHSP